MSARISRRQFLATAGTLPLAARLFAAHADVPVGLELYSVRDFLAKDLMGTVKAVANQGYQVVEFYSPYYDWTPQTAKEIRSLLDGLGVKCNSTHNSSNVFTPDGIKKAVDLNQTIGSKYIVMASPGEVKNADSWKAVADRLNAASETLKPAGMAAGYHNHGAEWHPVDGKRPMDILASNTSHDVVLQFDIGTCVEAGADPVAWINANPGRIKSMHCKDWAAGGRGYAALFGEGDAPWAKIFEAAEKTGGIEYYLVEQEAGPADEQLQRSEKCLANFKKLKV